MSGMDSATDFQSVLGELRDELDALDERLVTLLRERADVIRRVIERKTQHGLGPVDLKREKEMLSRIRTQAVSVGLDPEIATRVLRAVIEAFTETEAKTLGSGSPSAGSPLGVPAGPD